jgi:polyribonucleotide nucleotidyltransferase
MATVCGSTLALMDAGVPITDPVAGISIGLVKEESNYVLLTDIMGDEDHYGDMDFKIAGTGRGVTGIQLDLKITAINEDIIRKTLQQARDARLEILRTMLSTLRAPRGEISKNAPRLITVKINPEKIGLLIGPGGKNIKAIQESTGTKVDIAEDGTVYISSVSADGAEMARNKIEAMIEDIKVGRVYEGKVSSIKDFGAFIEIAPGRDGLCHISELAEGFVSRVEDVVKVGDIVKVKVIAIDNQDRVKLSRKILLQEEAGVTGGGEGSGSLPPPPPGQEQPPPEGEYFEQRPPQREYREQREGGYGGGGGEQRGGYRDRGGYGGGGEQRGGYRDRGGDRGGYRGGDRGGDRGGYGGGYRGDRGGRGRGQGDQGGGGGYGRPPRQDYY